jgi:CheY-like chemotaxis protein
MPNMEGEELARRLRERCPGLPLVVLSSGDGGVARGSTPLTKPVKIARLHAVMVGLLGGTQTPRPVPAPKLDPEMASRLPLRILIAEDDVVNQKVALHLLGRLGYRADVAANGLEAVDAVQRQPYDVVLMDMQMPEMDGLEATRTIRRQLGAGRQPRIVAITANARPEDRQACFDAGMDDFASKPV